MTAKPTVFEIARRLGKSPSVAGRALQKKRPTVHSTCAVCRQPMLGYADKAYCSPRCSMRAARARWKAARPSTSRPSPATVED